MHHPPEELATTYRIMSEPDLLDLASTYDSLTESAQTALRAEFSHRNLEPPLIETEDLLADTPLVTISRYRDLSEAIVARSFLEAAGIPVHLQDENLVRLDWQVSNFIGGIRLQVPAVHREAAIELLSQPIASDIDTEDGVGFTQPRCPVCDSLEITFQGHSRGAAIAALYAFSIPLPTGRATWLCESCGARWEDEEENEEPKAP